MIPQHLVQMAALPSGAYEALMHSSAQDESPDMARLRQVLGRLRQTAALHAANGFSAQVTADSFTDVGVWAATCLRQTGQHGLTEQGYNWILHTLDGRLYRIGRLQIRPALFPASWNIRVFRRREDGQTIALADQPIRFRSDGQVDGTNGIPAGEEGFDGYCQEVRIDGIAHVQGTPISPLGVGENKILRLSLTEYEEVLTAGMPTVEIHIPEGPGMTPQACRNSLLEARRFLDTHGQSVTRLMGISGPYAAFTINSWLMDTQFEALLPPQSNIVQFLSQFYIIPVQAQDDAALERIFGSKQIDPHSFTPDQQTTSLQRTIAQFMAQGGRLRHACGFVLMGDLDCFGEQPYRKDS